MSVMLLGGMAVYAYIVMNGDNARESLLTGPCTSERCPGTSSD